MKTMNKKEDVAGASQQFLPGTARSLVAAGQNQPAPSPAQTPRSLEAGNSTYQTMLRLSEVIAREIRMFKRGGDDATEVILTPNLQTQISLRLQWREGQVVVQAWCDRGEPQSLALHWPQLQAHLADYHVRLADLINRTATGYTEFFQHYSTPTLKVAPPPNVALAAEELPLALKAAPLPRHPAARSAAKKTYPA